MLRKLKKMDTGIIFILAMLMVISVCATYSAGIYFEKQDRVMVMTTSK